MNGKPSVLLDLAASCGFTPAPDDSYNIGESDLMAVMERVDAPPKQSMTVTPLSAYEQYALIALRLMPVALAPVTHRVELSQGAKCATLYVAHPEHLVRIERDELLLLRSGGCRIETVSYERLQALSEKLHRYRTTYFTENPVNGNATRAAEHFIDWARNGNKPTYCCAPSWNDLLLAIRSCAYNTGLRRVHGVHIVTLSKIPNTCKLHLEV